ncbi:SH3 domain-binding glutamic acid-rich protein homolog isoform X2 [Eriocheir sinensis]|uniref:SH3 domain-binding glutamic acid-rich protein homolog isoform X2 n=2 Tax=Eriocheir sinensis TaxID=95602 RepID=UPI0021CA9DC3|nr:SH3 domain-binding glutamic acid-rich protein homolog isoform X2 [Eriocheir sinensis]
MVIKVYVSLISCSQEVKKNQQRAVMILESKNIPFTTIDITDPGQEDSKEYMNENAKPKGNNRVPMTPQLFNEAEYCGDFDDLDMANENDQLGEFLRLTEDEKKKIKIGITGILPEERAKAEQQKQQMTNGNGEQEADTGDQGGEADAQPEEAQDAEGGNAVVDGPEGGAEFEFRGEEGAAEVGEAAEVREAGGEVEEGGEEAGGMEWPVEEQDPFAAPVEGNSTAVQMEDEAEA